MAKLAVTELRQRIPPRPLIPQQLVQLRFSYRKFIMHINPSSRLCASRVVITQILYQIVCNIYTLKSVKITHGFLVNVLKLHKGGYTMYQESFPSKLKQAREINGFTQSEAAEEMNIQRYLIANYETGRTQPDIETLGTLADFYGVSVDWLLGTKGGKK